MWKQTNFNSPLKCIDFFATLFCHINCPFISILWSLPLQCCAVCFYRALNHFSVTKLQLHASRHMALTSIH